MTSELVALRTLKKGDVLDDESGRAPSDRLTVTDDPQHIGQDFFILDVEDRVRHSSAFPPQRGDIGCRRLVQED